MSQKIGMITSPTNGQPVLVIVKVTPNGKEFMDRGQTIGKPRNPEQPTMRRLGLVGKVGDVFNYITRENYGKRDINIIS